jgi:S1-C subfamily serine protease
MSGLISRLRHRRRAAQILLMAVLLAALGCGGSDSETTQTQSSAASKEGPLTAEQIEQKVRPSTVSIVTQPRGESKEPSKHGQHAHGSGVIWDASRGLVLTSDHLVENAGSIEVTVNNQTPVHAALVARAQCNDIAIIALRPRPAGMTQISRGDSAALKIGARVWAMGYLKPASATKARGITIPGEVSSTEGPFKVSPDLKELPSAILHQAALQREMSGGPLVNDRGELVGVNTIVPTASGAAPPGPSAAVSSNYLKRRIEELKPGKRGILIGWKDQHSCHGQMLEIAGRVLVSHGAAGGHEHH